MAELMPIKGLERVCVCTKRDLVKESQKKRPVPSSQQKMGLEKERHRQTHRCVFWCDPTRSEDPVSNRRAFIQQSEGF